MMLARAASRRSLALSTAARSLTTASPRTVVALGGNALVRPGEEGTPQQQQARASRQQPAAACGSSWLGIWLNTARAS